MFGASVRNQFAFIQNNSKKWMEQMKRGMTADLVFENMSKELKTPRPPCDNSVTPLQRHAGDAKACDTHGPHTCSS